MPNINVPDPDKWAAGLVLVIDKVGLLGTISLMLAFGMTVGLAWKPKELADGVNGILTTLLAYLKARKTIDKRLKLEQERMGRDLKTKANRQRKRRQTKND